MILRPNGADRRESAQIRQIQNHCLANAEICSTVKVVSGDVIFAPNADDLFRTPSLSGQAFTVGECLPAFYLGAHKGFARRRSANPWRTLDSQPHERNITPISFSADHSRERACVSLPTQNQQRTAHVQ